MSKKLIKRVYRLIFYNPFKHVETAFRGGFFFILEKIFKGFNAFRVFGIPRRVVSIKGELVYSRKMISRTLPKTPEMQIPENFLELKAPTCEGRVAVIPQGIATEKAAHLTRRGELIQEFTQQFTMTNIKSHKLFTFRKERLYPSIFNCEGQVASLVADGHWNYYHWLFDVLPKLHLIQKNGLSYSNIYVKYSSHFQKSTLRLLGVKETQIINSDDIPFFSASSLIVSSFPAEASAIPPWVVKFLRDQFLPKERKPNLPKRLFISRKEANYRNILNEEELLPFLKKAGFKILQLEKHSFEEQVSYFHEADVILSPHGAGLANLVFCRPQTRVIEIFPPRFLCSCYWSLSNAVSLNYSFLIGEDKKNTYSDECEGYDNIWIDTKNILNIENVWT